MVTSCIEKCCVSPSSVVLKKALFERLGGFDPDYRVCEDYDLWLRISLEEEFGFLPEAMLKKRSNGQIQLSFQYMGKDLLRLRSLLKIRNHANLKAEETEALAIKLDKITRIFLKVFIKKLD